MKSIRIGCGAGYSGDRIDSAVELAQHGRLDYLVLECLAERTIALAQLDKLRDPGKGYGQFLDERMTALLPLCKEKGFKIITNIGAANPEAALNRTVEIGHTLGLQNLKIAALEGSDVLADVLEMDCRLWENNVPVSLLRDSLISADAYLGVQEMLPTFKGDADVIITGRVADPSLFLAPMVHSFDWSLDDWPSLGRGTALAHLIECSAQVSGGYFADSFYKKVPQLDQVGFPLVEVDRQGKGFVTKVEGSGGIVNLLTCKEQLLYEVGDPSCYITPDVSADFSRIVFKQSGQDRVEVLGAWGNERPQDLKVTVGVMEGYLGEALISFAGHHALERTDLARDILKKRYNKLHLDFKEIRFDKIGINALHGSIGEKNGLKPYEVILRVALKSDNRETAEKAVQEAEALWLNGPGGVGGIRKNVSPLLAAYSTTIPRSLVKPRIRLVEVN